MSRYTIGIDCGTLAARVVVVDVENGREVGSAECVYAHGVIDRALPGAASGAVLPADWALCAPQDYLTVLYETVPEAVRNAGTDPDSIVGIGTDCTTSTMMPVDRNGDPLCLQERWKDHPHAWAMLWKHHAAQRYADRMTETAQGTGQPWLARYGGKISSEWVFPKLWQILEEDPELYEAAYAFMEISDWLVMKMTGRWGRNTSALGYKALWDPEAGFPDEDYFAALHPGLRSVVREKILPEGMRILPSGGPAGPLCEEAARKMGLRPGTAVAAAFPDAHVALPAVKITEPGKMLLIMGTSTCDILPGRQPKTVPGICGVVKDGSIPGFYAYEAGQSGVGDILGWFAEECVPESYAVEARERGLSLHRLLEEKAARRDGGQRLLALDWLSGNRSVLVDAGLSGMILGLTLQTKPEDIYRALMEATAFGQRIIFETFESAGVPVGEVCAAGGLPEKNHLMMQIYANVLNRTIHIAGSTQASALGSAIFAAWTAGVYPDMKTASDRMGSLKDTVYRPVPEQVRGYETLYREYKKLHDYFGRGGSAVMKVLNGLKTEEKPNGLKKKWN